jgi:hypothetical protein
MEVSEVLNLAQAVQAQRTDIEKQSLVLLKMKEQEELQLSLAARLLGSLPNAKPEGMGCHVDCLA